MNQLLLMTGNPPLDVIYPIQTIWVRGVCITLHQTRDVTQIKVGDYLMEQCEQTFQTFEAFQTFVSNYKYDLIKGCGAFQIPQARMNSTDEFVYQTDQGEWAVLSGFANFQWTDDQLSSTEIDSGSFYLAKTNETLGTLIDGHYYTVLQFKLTGEPARICIHQTLADVKALIHQKDYLMSYLDGQLLIFDEEKQVHLKGIERDAMVVEALNQNSGYKRLPVPLTKELKQVYFARQDLQRRFGFNVDKAKVVPSAFTLRQTKGGQVKVVRYYHSDLIPQHFFCKCGKNKQSTGPVSDRICLDCLQAYQEKSRERSVQEFKAAIEPIQGLEPIEKVFVVMHTSQGPMLGTSAPRRERELINICLMNEAGDVLLESLIKPTTVLSKSSYERGYRPAMFENAPSFEEIQPQIEAFTRGKVVVYFNAKERQAFYEALCQQHGLIYELPTHAICLKEVLMPLSRASKQIHKMLATEESALTKNARGLSAECHALGIPVAPSSSIKEDAAIMRRIYHALVTAD